MCEEILTDIQQKLKNVLDKRFDIVFTHKWFEVFSISEDAFKTYSYAKFPKFVNAHNAKITNLTLVEEPYFDYKYHFELTLKVGSREHIFNVTLNEAHITDSFF